MSCNSFSGSFIVAFCPPRFSTIFCKSKKSESANWLLKFRSLCTISCITQHKTRERGSLKATKTATAPCFNRHVSNFHVFLFPRSCQLPPPILLNPRGSYSAPKRGGGEFEDHHTTKVITFGHTDKASSKS